MQKPLTQATIAAAKPHASRDVVIADEAIAGYQLKVTPNGRRVLSLLYWSPVEKGKRRRVTIGTVGEPVTMPNGTPATLTAHTGRKIAEALRGEVTAGRDPFLDMQQSKRAQQAAEHARRAKEAADRPVRAVAAEFLADARERGLSDRTVREWERLLGKHVLPVIGEVPIADVGPEDAKSVRRAMPRGRRILANRVQQVSCALLNFAEADRGTRRNPFALGKRGANRWHREELTREPLTRDELSALFAALDAEPNPDRGGALDAIRFLALTGWRKGEALSLRWDAVDLENGAALLTRTKTGRSSRALAPEAIALLQAIPMRGPFVFPSPRNPGAPLVEIKRTWNKVRRAAGIAKPLHALRHTAATVALSEGVPLATVGALLGHRHPATTLRYAKTEHEAARAGAGIMGAAIAKAGAPTDVTPITAARGKK